MRDTTIPPFSVQSNRFRHSPFYACYAVANATLGVYNRRLYAWTLGDDVTATYWTLRRKAVLYDVPETPIEITGPDAERLLDKALTRDMTKLRVGRAAYGLACLPDGGLLMDGVVMRLGAERFFYVQADGEFLPWLAALGVDLDVTVRDPDSWVLQVQGPRSLEVLGAARDGGAPEPFDYFDVAECALGGQPVVVSRTGWTGELGFEVYTRPDTDGPALWRHLLATGAAHGLIHGGLDSMGIRRIEAGIIDYGTDTDTAMTPFQAGLGKFVDLEKPNFVGKQALAAADRRVMLYGLRCPEATPRRFGAVRRGDTRIGGVTTASWSPYLDCGIAFVRMDQPGDWLGAAVTVTGGDGAGHAAEIVALPFYDDEKKIARGLDTTIP